MIGRIAAVLTLVFVLLGVVFTPVLADSGGTVTGKLVNGTKDGGSVAGLTVTLKTFVNDAEIGSTSATADAEGNFTFTGLATDSKNAYEAAITYQTVDYTSSRVSFGEGETAKSVDLTIYESTTENIIKVDMTYTVVTVGEGSLAVESYLIITNETDRTYVGSIPAAADPTKKETINFPLAKGATALQYYAGLMECCVLPGGDGFIDTMAVLPGTKEIDFAYELPYKSKEYVYSQKLPYATGQYVFLVEGDTVNATSDQLAPGERLKIGEKLYSHLIGTDLPAGNTITVRLAGLTPAGQNPVLYVAVAVVVLGGGAGGFYAARRRKLQPVVPAAKAAPSRDDLLAEIARLDDEFEAGSISEDRYRLLRARMKAQLVVMTKRSK